MKYLAILHIADNHLWNAGANQIWIMCLFDVWQLASHLATKLPCDTHNNNNV